MALKFYTSVEKGLKLEVWKFYGLTFIEVTGGKQVREDFLPPLILNRVNEERYCIQYKIHLLQWTGRRGGGYLKYV